jgi:hypothetical protein
MNRRLLVPAGAVLGAIAALGHHVGVPQNPPDFLQWWTAARAVLHGQNAYEAVKALSLPWPWFYPLSAAVPVLPLATLPLVPAHMLWSAAGGALLGYAAIDRHGLGPSLVSAAFLGASAEGHWSPFLVAATVVPWLAFVWAAKPSVGLAYFAGYGSARAAVLCVGLTAIAFAIDPYWIRDWLDALAGGTLSVAPITRPGGFLLLLGLLRWRTPEGRLFAAFALVPQTTVIYEALPVFLCAQTKREGYALAVLTFVAAFGHYLTFGVPTTVARQSATLWPWLLLCCYLPALALILRPQPSTK